MRLLGLVNNTNVYLLSCTVSELRLIICQILASGREVPHSNALARGDHRRISLELKLTYLQKLHSSRYISVAESIRVFNQFYVIGPESYRIRQNNATYTAITPFKVIQGHRIWYQSKAHATSY